MNERAIQQSPSHRWPMTGEARRALVDEVARLRRDLDTAAGGGHVVDGVIHLPVAKAGRRLEMLSAVVESAEVEDAADRAVIGRRVTLLEQDGESVTYAITFPGDGDPSRGWIAADAPLGAAVLGRHPGDHVEVLAPAGRRVVRLVTIE